MTGQMAFYDVRVFNPLARRYENLELQKCYELNEKEKKKSYNSRILEIEHGSLTPLVFSAMGGMGRECQKFYSRLSQMIAEKKSTSLALTSAWVRRKITFAMMRTLHMCVRGSRTVRPRQLVQDDVYNPEVSEFMSAA